jgi:hypothetical protein
VRVGCCGGTVKGDCGTERLEAFEWDCDALVGGRHCGYLLLYEIAAEGYSRGMGL